MTDELELRVLVLAQSMRNEEAMAVLRGPVPLDAARAEIARRDAMPNLFEVSDGS